MKSSILPAAAAALTVVALMPSHASAQYWRYPSQYRRATPSFYNSYGAVRREYRPGEYRGPRNAPGFGPYWQGEPSNKNPVWRNGYYQGNDPDNFVRGQLMRDPLNGQSQ
jgi:hypothetical protein